MSPVVVGVIVAAGASTRMGEPKQLLPIGDRPLLQWVVDAAEASRLDQVVVVTGHASEEVRSAIRLRRGTFADNPHPEEGTMSSLRAGLAVATGADAVMKLVGDQPEIATGVIDELIEAWGAGRSRSALVRYRDGDGHPMMFATDALDEVINQDGDRLLWQLMEDDPGGVHRLVVDGLRPIDVNDRDSYRRACARLG